MMIYVNDENINILLNELEQIYLKYMDYGSCTTHSIFGNKNYLRITEKSGNKYDFEILIRSRNSKNELKRILNSPEFYEKFDFVAFGNTYPSKKTGIIHQQMELKIDLNEN